MNQAERMLRLRMLRGSRTVTVLLVALVFPACKAARETDPPNPVLVDDLVTIESELALNESRLQSQGIVVPRPAPATPPTISGGGAESPRVVDSDDAASPVAPAAPPPTEPEAEPTAVMDEEDDVDSERDTKIVGQATRRKDRRRRRRGALKDSALRCERICDLAETTCELADRICSLANEHVDEVRYENACARAESQCEVAAAACTSCVE